VGIDVTDTADAKLVIRSTGVDGTFAPVVSFQYSGNANEHNSIGSSVATASANSGINFKISNGAGSTGQTEMVRITRDGLLFNGDTASANALDDYEEGTWVPAILSAGNACDATVSHVDGAYTKIGRLVTAMIRLRTTNKGTATGQMGITLPFAVADALSSTGLEGSASVGNYAGVTVTHAKLSGAPIEGTSSMRFYYIATSNTNLVNQLTVAQLASVFDIRVTISYMT
jgi:hypothetical protein